MPKQRTANLVWCLAIGWCFVAPKTAWGKARRGSIAAALCDRGVTRPQAVFGATLRAAVLFASRFVARSSQTAEGYARRSRLAGNENYLRRNTSQLRDTTLARWRRRSGREHQIMRPVTPLLRDSGQRNSRRSRLSAALLHCPGRQV